MYSNPTGFGQQQQQQQPQYGAAYGQQQPPMMGQQQQQPQPFAPQPTGFGQPAPLQNQYTGFPMAGQQQQQPQPLMGQATGLQPQQSAFQPQQTGFQPQQTGFQPQNTGFQPQQQQFQQSAMPPMPSIPAQYQQQYQQQQPQQPQQSQFQQPPQQQQQPAPSLQLPQATGFPSVTPPQQTSSAPSLIPPPPAPPQKAQATGFAQMAASFQTSKPQTPAAPSKPNSVPNIRLSFITASDQARFENLFAKSVGDGNTTMTGEKARDLLLRSRLDGDSLSQIWTLADTTRSGQLHFPEFALAMYLCNLKLTGKALPPVLPDTIKNEVSSMVDIINFSIAEQVAASGRATPLAAPQPQPSNSQLLQTQMTGFPGTQQIPQIQQSQPTGFQPQPTGFQAQPTGFQSQQTGIQTQATGYNTQGAGYNGPRPPMPPMPSSFSSGLAPMAAPLNAQPTGRPGQWGLVNTPATGLPNIDALAARMMPQNDRASGSFTTSGLQGNAVIPWAITKDEKIRYDSLFNTWDGLNKGFIGGSQAREIFEQSGLEKPDLERIWTLADSANKGRLDMDEFAIAMHLIYRKLNGYPVPSTLPPELVPPSTRNLTKSIGAMKNMLHEESEHRKNSGAALLPQKTGVSYAKNHSFKSGSGVGGIGGRKDATVFKNNDDDVGYRSSARRRANNRSPQPGTTPSNDEELSLDQLRKKVREKQVLLDAMDFKDEKNSEEDDILDRRDRRDADDLYRRIRRIQEDIDSHPDAALSSGDSDAERRALKRQLQKLTDKIPELASAVRRTEKEISEARLELFRIRDAKQYPGSATSIIGTGPGGAITESDRLKARAKAMMQQRTAALTGRKIEGASDDLDAPKRLEEESMKIRYEKENNERMVQDVEDSVREFSRSIEDNLKSEMKDSSSEHERRRWEDALGVEDEVRDFIFDLQRDSRSARLRAQEKRGLRAEPPSRTDSPASRLSNSSPAGLAKTSSPAPSAGGSYSSYETPEQRAAFIKQQAEQRMAERLAALGIKAPTKPGESAAQRIERERAEREAKLRQAEEEDSRREAQRQARLAEEQGVPVPVEPVEEPKQEPKKAPPPPATRKAPVAKPEPTSAAAPQDDYDNEREAAESRLRALEEQVRQNKLRKEEEKKKKKAALAEAKERESKAAARRAEIEAVRKREEELQRQLASMDDDSDSSDDSEGPGYTGSQGLDAPPPAPAPAPVSVSPPPSSSPSVPSAAAATSPPAAATSETESKNPFFRMMSQSSSSTPTTAPAVPAPAPPAAPAAATSAADASTNPFFRPPPVSSTPVPAAPAAPVMPTLSISRDNQDDSDDDGWGSNNDNSDDESDDGRPGGNSAAHLASLLFSTMAPPRPMSAADEKPTSSSPVSSSPFPPPTASSAPPAPIAAPPVEAPEIAETPEVPVPISVPSGDAPPPPPPPPPPPMPTDAPAAPPPPPPPPPPPSAPGSAPSPGGGPPPPPPPPAPAPAPGGGSILSSGGPPAGLLGQIQLGKTLRKTNTQDKSAAVGAGRVL